MIQDYYTLGAGKNGETTARGLVLFLHGYGSEAHNIYPVVEAWEKEIPSALFVVPNAFDPVPDWQGYQWFPIPEITTAVIEGGVRQATPRLAHFIMSLQKTYGVPAAHTVVAGFSQGAMMALGMAAYEGALVGGILAYAGALVPQRLNSIGPLPAVALVHGDEDEVVSLSFSVEAESLLTKAGFDCALYQLPSVGHTLTPVALEIGSTFIKRVLSS